MADKWVYAIRKVKGNRFLSLSKNGACDFNEADYAFIDKLLGDTEQLTESVRVIRDPEKDFETALIAAGFEKNRTDNVLDYMKEEGRLR